mmetsp:Transcript_45866/g.103299  ORF Transcript_45866/g.103299 Transcript_45866/m.103299 type:complete len:102 (-) Transcript_45866:167-472(-)
MMSLAIIGSQCWSAHASQFWSARSDGLVGSQNGLASGHAVVSALQVVGSLTCDCCDLTGMAHVGSCTVKLGVKSTHVAGVQSMSVRLRLRSHEKSRVRRED